MNKKKAKQLIELYGQPTIKTEKVTLVFTRQNMKNVEEIEKMSDADLVSEWKTLVFMNNIYGLISLNEMQRISLIELEMDERKNINSKELNEWFEKKQIAFENQEEEI